MNCILLGPDGKTRDEIEAVIRNTDSLKILKSVDHIELAKDVLLDHKRIHVVFIHIEKPGMDGYDILDVLPHGRPDKIFLSSKKSLALEAFDHDGSDFILLPLTTVRLMKAIGRISKTNNNIYSSDLNSTFIFLKQNGAFHKVGCKEIIYIEALADYMIIHTAGKRFIVHSTMKGLLERLPPGPFVRVHKSYIVAIEKVTKIDANKIMVGDVEIPLSKKYKKDLISQINYLS